MVSELHERTTGHVHVVTGLTTITAMDNIRTLNPMPYMYYGLRLFNEIQTFLSHQQIELVKNFYQLEEGDNDLYNQYAVFFDHKMPGVFSSVPFVYAGLIPETNEEYPLIKGCSKGSYNNCPPVPYRKEEQDIEY